MKSEPLISVIVPVYNAEKTIGKCLESLLNQTYKNYEIIVVDNNSKDKSREIIKKIKENAKIPFSLVTEKKQGRGVARNKGIKKAKGEIIAMTDNDCILRKDWIEKITLPIRKEKEDIVIGFHAIPFKNYLSLQTDKLNEEFFLLNLENPSQKKLYIKHLDTKNFAIRSEVIKKFMFDPSIKNLEDLDLFLRISPFYKIRFLRKFKIKHVHRMTLVEVVRVNFDRGYWARKIYNKHKEKLGKKLKEIKMFESMDLINFLKFPLWILLQIFSSRFSYLVLRDLSWRIGSIYACIK